MAYNKIARAEQVIKRKSVDGSFYTTTVVEMSTIDEILLQGMLEALNKKSVSASVFHPDRNVIKQVVNQRLME